MDTGTFRALRLLSLAVSILAANTFLYAAPPWFSYGPDGGSARSFALDPHDHAHLYLGSTNGWLYESHDGGKTWHHGLNRVGDRDDLVLDSVVVDPSDSKHILAGTWSLEGPSSGGIYISHDGGVTWTAVQDMKGQSIHALKLAPSNPKIVIAGSWNGVYRSIDGGEHWSAIAKDINELASVAIDPRKPSTIYVGTWHLPWKTTDGGEHWESMKEGIIDDSDVFSIIVDPDHANVVYASACSGIYKSENEGASFIKVQGIPTEARRTRVLRQDPEHLETVFAGTTEGLYRSTDSGAKWERLTDPEMVVNDVYVDPEDSKHVLLATDRSGVMSSDDGGMSFRTSNDGFSARQVYAYAADPRHKSTIYVGLVNDKDAGGVFVSFDGGLRWTQDSVGLNGADVFSLVAAPDGSILAGAGHGIYRLDTGVWSASGHLDGTTRTAAPSKKGTAPVRRKTPVAAVTQKKTSAQPDNIQDTVYSLAASDRSVFAATSSGVLVSGDSGKNWKRVGYLPPGDWHWISVAGSNVFAAQLRKTAISTDGGVTWKVSSIPPNLSFISAVAVDGSGVMWLGGREGVLFSPDQGSSWRTLKDLETAQVNDIHDIYYDEPGDRILITGNRSSTWAYSVNLANRRIRRLETGWNLRMVRPMNDHLVAATLFDGIVVEPQMVVLPESAKW